MFAACAPFADVFVTPMAAVAGSVADELMAVMRAAAPLDRAYVNDGGDIAVFCAPGQVLDIAIAGDFSFGPVPARSGTIRIRHGDGVGGIATSGARGRSFSLGIANSVTVLAADAATADAAATLIANAVDCDHPAIARRPAIELDPDSDLGDRLVTVSVGPLPRSAIAAALAAGLARARLYRERGLIVDAALTLQGETVTLSPAAAPGKDRLVSVEVRKIVTSVEEIRHDGGPPLDKPLKKAWVAAVIKNPFAGRYEPEVAFMMDELKPLGLDCSKRLVAALGGDAGAVEAYGKGSLIGAAGEIEHARAVARAGRLCDARAARPGAGDRAVLGKARGARRFDRHPDPPQGRLLRAQPFRLHHRLRAGRAARRRDDVRAGDDDRRPAARAHGRPEGVGDFQVGRAALSRCPAGPACGNAL